MSSRPSHQEALASTACWIVAVRAHESERADRLFNDPWAGLLAGQAGQEWLDRIAALKERFVCLLTPHGKRGNGLAVHWDHLAQQERSPMVRLEDPAPQSQNAVPVHIDEDATELGIVIRTKFFDDFLLHTAIEHHIQQIVILAAGMDTRGFRLNWPERVRLFELDQFEVLDKKERMLEEAAASPACWRRSVAVDLEKPWSNILLRAGFDPRRPSAWLIEGLLPYLSEINVLQLFDTITALSTFGSWLGFNAINREMLTSRWTRFWARSMARAGIPWLSAMDEPEAILAERGWQASVIQPGEEGANFGRWPYPVIPRSQPGVPRNWFVTAMKKDFPM